MEIKSNVITVWGFSRKVTYSFRMIDYNPDSFVILL